MELLLAIVTLGTIRPNDSGAAFKQKNRVSGGLGMPEVKPLDMPKTPIIERVEENTLKTHHALSPHPHVINCTSFISSIAPFLSYYIVT